MRPSECRSPSRSHRVSGAEQIQSSGCPLGSSLPCSGSEYLAVLPHLHTLYLQPCGHCLLRPGLEISKKPVRKGWKALFSLHQQLPGGLRNLLQPLAGRNSDGGSFSREGASLPLSERRKGLVLDPQALKSPCMKLILPEPLLSAEHLLTWTTPGSGAQ